MNKKDVEKLEGVGFSQSAISDAAQVVGYFNYINRIADGVDWPISICRGFVFFFVSNCQNYRCFRNFSTFK